MSYAFGGLDFVIAETGVLQVWQRIEFGASQLVEVKFESEQMRQRVDGRNVLEVVVGQVNVAQVDIVL